MPAQPGRFSTSKKAQVWTSDQQINAGWLGPRACQPYSTEWQQCFSLPTDVPYSQFLMQAPDKLGQEMIKAIETALDLIPVAQQRAQKFPKVEKLALPASVPSFGQLTGRAKVGGILRAFACWKPEVGYHPVLALLAAHIMAAVGNERVTFQAMVTVFRRYQLEDYFVGKSTEEALQADAQKIWDAARVGWPDLAYAFTRFNRVDVFEKTVKSLLSTLLTQTYRPAMQPFEYHVRLLHHFLLPAGDADPANPRAPLRHLVLQIMARHQCWFLQCPGEAQLISMANDLERFVFVDDKLLEMFKCSHLTPEWQTAGPLWPSALMAGLGAVLALDVSSPLGLGAQVASATSGAVVGFVAGALESAQWGAEITALTNRALILHGEDPVPEPYGG